MTTNIGQFDWPKEGEIMRKMLSLLLFVVTAISAVPGTLSAQSWWEEEAYRMRQERRAIERARYEHEQRIAEARYRERVLQKEAERLDRTRRDAAEYFGGYGGNYGYGGYGGGAWNSWPRQNFPGYGDLYSYPYDYSYGGMSYRGAWGRVVPGGQYFDALVVPCRILSGRQRTEKFVAKILAGAVGGAVLDRDNRKRGALLGGGAGTAWALADDSNFCSPPEQVLLPMNLNPMGGGMSHGGVGGTSPSSSSLMSPDPLARVMWPTVNTTDFWAVVTDPNTETVRMIPAGGSMNLPAPAGDRPYTVELLAPGRGSVDRIPGEIRPSHDLQGWEVVARER